MDAYIYIVAHVDLSGQPDVSDVFVKSQRFGKKRQVACRQAN